MLSDAQKIRDGYLFGLGIAHVMAEIDVQEKKVLLSEATDEDRAFRKNDLDESLLTLNAVSAIMKKTSSE